MGRLAGSGIEHAASTEDWLRRTLDEIISQIRRLLDVSGCAFQVVDWEEGVIRPSAAWFSTDQVRAALTPILTRPYEPERPGVTEAAIEQGKPLLIVRFEEWEHATRLRDRLEERLDPAAASATWEWYRTSSFISCPVRTAAGRTLGVLAISSGPPLAPFGEDELRVVEVLADLAALALERSELLAREEQRTQTEVLLNDAAHAVTGSLDLETVYAAIIDQAARIAGAPKVALARYEPGTGDLRMVATRGFSDRLAQARFAIGEGMIGQVAQTGEPYVSRYADMDKFLSWVLEEEQVRSFVHVPISLGPRLFGVLSAAHTERGRFDDATLKLLVSFARSAAAGIANALDYQRERRVADALTQGFVAGPAPQLPGLDIGLIYQPAGDAVGGGDVFGAWTLPSGSVAVLIGDVTGKGLEVAALSSMVRFFVEARTWDSERPAEVLAQTDALLRRRLPTASFVSAFMGVIGDGRLRYCNAGHSPVLLLGAGGTQTALSATAMPMGVEEHGRYADVESPFVRGDVLFAATDGLAEARREGAFFGDARLPGLLAEHGRTLDPEALVELVHRELEQWTPKLDDDVVILALRRC